MWSYPDIPQAFKELHREILKNDKKGVSRLFPDIEQFIEEIKTMGGSPDK